MKIFDISSDLNHIFDWTDLPDASYKGIILPNAKIHSLHGGFGNFVFQHIPRKIYSLWFSNYECRQRFKTHSLADVRLIELSILLENSISYTFGNPLGRLHQKGGQFNIFNSLDIDNKVQFEKSAFYTTLDIHPDVELLMLLYEEYPELLDPLLEAIAAQKEYLFFEKPLFLTYPMIQLVDQILDLLKSTPLNTFLLDMCVVTLFALAVSCKLDMYSKNYSHERKQEIEQKLAGLMYLLLSEEKFISTKYYAQHIGMSSSSLKQHFRKFYGSGLEEFWRKERMKKAFQDVVTSNIVIDALADKYNYSDGPAFTKAFKRIYKFPPSFYRHMKDNK